MGGPIPVPKEVGSEDLVVVGPTSMPIPRKLCDKIWANQFVDMQDLLPAKLGASEPSWSDLVEAARGKSSKKGKAINSIEQWVTCFNTYMIIMAMKKPERIPDLLAYSSKIVQSSRCYEGMLWLAYDVHFRRQAAAKGVTSIAETDSSIWTLYFGRASPRVVCKDCMEPGHRSCVGGEIASEEGEAKKGGKSKPWNKFPSCASPYQGGRLCKLFNSKEGCHYTPNCIFEHRCMICWEKGHTRFECMERGGNTERGGIPPFRNREGESSRKR